MGHRHYNGLKTAALFGVMWAVLLGIYALVGGGNRSLFLVFAAIGVFGTMYGYWNSDKIAIRAMRARPVSELEQPAMYRIVRELSTTARQPMPRLFVSPTMAPNAFATGAFKNSSLVAVSTGLLQGMTKEEIEAVLGHEIAHVANGDMVTMTLIQGVMNTFVVFLSRVIGYAVDSFLRRGSDSNSGPGIGYYVSTIVLDIVLGFAAAIVVAWFSRHREFRADAGAAQLMGRRQPMMNALARLGGMQPGELPKAVEAMGITGGIGKWFATHPPIEERIAALQNASFGAFAAIRVHLRHNNHAATVQQMCQLRIDSIPAQKPLSKARRNFSSGVFARVNRANQQQSWLRAPDWRWNSTVINNQRFNRIAALPDAFQIAVTNIHGACHIRIALHQLL